MNTVEKIKLAIKKGITCDLETGNVYGTRGGILKSKCDNGYLVIRVDNSSIKQHQFIFYLKNGYLADCIDHINKIKTDNRADNLRKVTRQENTFNRDVKGYHFNKNMNKYQSSIRINNVKKHLGYFDTEKEAIEAYLNAKKIYHNING
jgi:hypothetical protein